MSTPAQTFQSGLGNADTAALLTLTATGAGTYTTNDMPNVLHKGVALYIYLATCTTANVTVTIQGKDAASGQYYTLLASSAISTASGTLLVVNPGSTTAANSVSTLPLPATWRVSVTIADNGGTSAVTGTIGASLIK